MSIEIQAYQTYDKTLLGSIGENHRYIKTLLKTKANTIKEVQSAMDKKAHTKTPLNEGQQRAFNDFTGFYAKEGGKLQESLMRMEHVQHDLHNENNTQPFILSLLILQRHQNNAIKSLRRMIASGEKILSVL